MNSCFDDGHGRSDIDLTYGRDALIKQSRKLSDELYNSLTWDRGKELSDHKRFKCSDNGLLRKRLACILLRGS